VNGVRGRPSRRWVGRWVAGLTLHLLALGAVSLSAVAGQPPADPEIGQRIYRQGILPSGEVVRATIQGDVEVRGSQFHCASCHRRSGFGSSEGGVYVPPVTAPRLFADRLLDRAELFREFYQEVQPPSFRARVRDPRVRPAYGDASLAVALRQGRDPTGRELDPLMPRYRLSDEEMAHLVAYLKTLGAEPDPGVDEGAIHFATVVTPGVDPAELGALRAVLDGYLRRKNNDTRGQLAHPNHSPWHRDDFLRGYREWKLEIWQLEGPSDSWSEQLDTLYRQRPVFALLAGLGVGDWGEIHRFCERRELPCLFPNTDLPVVTSPPGDYSLYLSKGLSGEAEALAHYLQTNRTLRLLQVYRDSEASSRPAGVLRAALQGGATELVERKVEGELDAAFWRDLIAEVKPTDLVLWLGESEFEALSLLPQSSAGPRRIYLSFALLGEVPRGLPPELSSKVFLTYPFALPGREIPRRYRVRAWLRSRRIEPTHPRVQLNAYFALSITDHALLHMLENFSRDLFVESVEHEAENALNPGVFPHLSLGPGQRFASKGCYIVKLSPQSAGGIEAVSGWIVP